MDLNSIVGLEIINAKSASRLGTVIDVIFDRKIAQIKALLCIDEEDNELVFSLRYAISISDCILTAKNRLEDYYPSPRLVRNVIGRRVIDTEGRYLGIVNNVIFDGSATASVLSDEVAISPRSIVTTEGRKILIRRPLRDSDCATLPDTTEDAPAQHTPVQTPEVSLMGAGSAGSFDFLQKMRTRTALFDHTGRLLIPSGKNIDAQDIAEAIRHDKIMELCCISEDVGNIVG